jgi:serine/threonine-protein kinase
MSPEQARGRQLDRRTDVWAFGCVLYEMLTGSRAFGGDDVQDTLASVLARDPDWRRLPPDTPAALHRLLRRCLQKDPTTRLRDMGDATLEIGEAIAGVPDAPHTSQPGSSGAARRKTWAVGIAGLAIGAVASLVVSLTLRPPAPATSSVGVQRFSMTFPASASITAFDRSFVLGSQFALAADGSGIAYVGAQRRLYFRALAEPEPRVLPGTELAATPFFSPDGEWIGFVSARVGQGGLARLGQLKKISVRGGTPVVLAEAVALGGSWGSDDTIVFSRQTDQGVGLFTIPASGGTPRQLTMPAPGMDGVRHAWPRHLPGGDALIFSETDQPTFDTGRLVGLSLRTGAQHVVVEQGYAAQYVTSGHLVYVLDGAIMAVRFDSGRARTTGAPVRVVPGVRAAPRMGWPGMSVTEAGLLLFARAGDAGGLDRALEWVSPDGRTTPVVSDRGQYSYPRLSPDGRRLAVGDGNDLWIVDLERGTRTARIAAEERGTDPAPTISAWTADGLHLAFNRRSSPEVRLEWVDPDAIENATVLLTRPHLLVPGSWSPDGILAFFQFPGGTERDLWVLEPGTGEPRPFLVGRSNERGPVFSPDGSWIAYVANPTGRDQVYLRPYPGPGPQVPVSNDGGTEPVWSRDGRDLFYRDGDRLMAVSVEPGPAASLGRPRVVFEQPYAVSDLGVANYDVGPDGRFIMITPPANAVSGDTLTVVQNWHEELKRLVPAN